MPITILPRSFKSHPNPSPQFTRRHYIWLTTAVRDLYSRACFECGFEPSEISAIEYGIKIFAEALASDNPRFNKEQFLSAILNPASENPNDR